MNRVSQIEYIYPLCPWLDFLKELLRVLVMVTRFLDHNFRQKSMLLHGLISINCPKVHFRGAPTLRVKYEKRMWCFDIHVHFDLKNRENKRKYTTTFCIISFKIEKFPKIKLKLF